jgi:hypothetical protein
MATPAHFTKEYPGYYTSEYNGHKIELVRLHGSTRMQIKINGTVLKQTATLQEAQRIAMKYVQRVGTYRPTHTDKLAADNVPTVSTVVEQKAALEPATAAAVLIPDACASFAVQFTITGTLRMTNPPGAQGVLQKALERLRQYGEAIGEVSVEVPKIEL